MYTIYWQVQMLNYLLTTLVNLELETRSQGRVRQLLPQILGLDWFILFRVQKPRKPGIVMKFCHFGKFMENLWNFILTP